MNLATALEQFRELLDRALATGEQEVATYASEVPGVRFDAAQGRFAGAGDPLALTRISRDGSVATHVVWREGMVDKELARLHGALVQLGLKNAIVSADWRLLTAKACGSRQSPVGSDANCDAISAALY